MVKTVPWTVLGMFLGLIVGFSAAGLWWWAGYALLVGLVLALVEALALRHTGQTLSAQAKSYMERRPLAGAFLAALLGAVVGLLIYHLATGV